MPLITFEVVLPSKEHTTDLQKLGLSLYTARELNMINVVLGGKKTNKKQKATNQKKKNQPTKKITFDKDLSLQSLV